MVLDLKDAFYLLRRLEDSKKYCGILPNFRSASYMYQRMPMGLNISPSIWQSYINAILECLPSRKHCKVIIDDLLLFTPSKKVHMVKLKDSLKALLKTDLRYPHRNVSYLKKKYNLWETLYLCYPVYSNAVP